MDDKYYRLQEIEIDRFDLDAPVEIEKGVLLLDIISRNVLLELKLNVLEADTSRYSSVSVNIDCMDDAMEIIGALSPYTFTYRDIFLNKSKAFGEDNPILLEPRVRRLKVGINRVVFTDASTWQPTTSMFTPPKQELINTLQPELFEQFQRDIRLLSPAERESYIFIPKQLDNYWLCTCGRPNLNDADICSRCSLSKKPVIDISVDTLQKKLDIHEEQSKLEKEKYQQEMEQKRLRRIEIAEKNRLEYERVKLQEIENKKKIEQYKAEFLKEERVRLQRKKIIRFVLVLFVLLITVYLGVILPAMRYSEAVKYFDDKDYTRAVPLLSALGDYKNSKEMVNEIQYQDAIDLLSKGQLDSATSIFVSLGDYKNSADMLTEADYQRSVQLLTDKNYLDAIQLLNSLGNYKDSSDLLLEANYQLGVMYLQDTFYYEEAVAIFSSLGSYKDSAVLMKDTTYLLAVNAYRRGDFITAQTYFENVTDYKDTGKYLRNLQILIAAQGTWKNSTNDFRIIFDRWTIKSSDKSTYKIESANYSENDIIDNGLKITFSGVLYVFNYGEMRLAQYGSEVVKFNKIDQSSVPFSIPSSSSSSSQCQTLRDNLELALILSGGYETDLTRLYRKALKDENCGN